MMRARYNIKSIHKKLNEFCSIPLINQFYLTLKAMRIKTFFLISILLTSSAFGFAYNNNPAADDINFEKRFSSFYNRLNPIQQGNYDVDDAPPSSYYNQQEGDYNQVKRKSYINTNYLNYKICLWYVSLCKSNGQPPASLLLASREN